MSSRKRNLEIEAAWGEGWDEGFAVGYWWARQELGVEDGYSRHMSRKLGADKGNASRRASNQIKQRAALTMFDHLRRIQPTVAYKVHVSQVCEKFGIGERTLRRWRVEAKPSS